MAQQPSQAGGFSRWLVRKLKMALAFLVVFVAGAVAMHLGMHAGDHAKMQALQAQVRDQQASLAQAQAAQAAAQSAADVQAGTQRALQDKVAQLQQQLGQVRDQLAFYEQLIPPGPAGAVAVRAFDVQPEGDFLHYRVLLSRNAAAGAQPFKGRMRFVALGTSQGKAVKIQLSPPQTPEADQTQAAAGAADPLALVFDQFQRSTGVLQLAPGLQVQSVRLEILEGDTVRATQDAALNRAASPAQEPHHDSH
ncbi:DUF6776 family protein [Castellaniella caeni]|uniref:DUF6776 family protein n=1 Tax=Castellaniella caeni TaxID=266123 RepID=UPI00082BE75D|nr:DUF6776 family protein [Castellaniella caeni]